MPQLRMRDLREARARSSVRAGFNQLVLRFEGKIGVADKKNPDDVAEPTPIVEDAEFVEITDADGVAESEAQEVDDTDAVESLSSETETETQDVPEAAEITAEPAPAPQVEQVIVKRGGFVPTVLGGEVAAAIGFGLAKTDVLDGFLPIGSEGAELEAMKTTQSSLETALAALNDKVGALQIPNLDPLANRVDALEAFANDNPVQSAVDLTPLETKLADLETQLSALAARPVTGGASPEAIAAFDAEIAKLQDSFTAQRAEVEAMFAEAQALEAASAAAAKIASAQTVIARLRAAVDAGQPFASHLEELTTLGISVPADLSARAADGVLPLAALREGFVPAARDALSAERDETTGGGGLTDYVKRHLGARSVAPREGEDTDAVLSRAEAAARSGDLVTALRETEALPDAASAAMADWIAAAQARLDTINAAETLSQSLNAK